MTFRRILLASFIITALVSIRAISDSHRVLSAIPTTGTTGMNYVPQALSLVKTGTHQTYKDLTIIPLVGSQEIMRGIGIVNYLTMDEALKAKTLEIEDISEVNTVRIKNTGKLPVLLVDGEEIIGAKQNRIFNASVLVPAGKTISVSVSCVEHGRWSGTSMSFGSGGTQLFAKARQSNQANVNKSVVATGKIASDQQNVWKEVAANSMALAAPSTTSAMHKVFEAKASDLEGFVKNLQPVENQVGAIFIVKNKVAGLDLFDCTRTLKLLYPKLVKSYAVDAITPGEKADGDAVQQANLLLKTIPVSDGLLNPSQGLGNDLRISGWMLEGGALIWGDKCVHLCIFPQTEKAAKVPEVIEFNGEQSRPRPRLQPRERQFGNPGVTPHTYQLNEDH